MSEDIDEILCLINCFQEFFFVGKYKEMGISFAKLTEAITRFLAVAAVEVVEAILPILKKLLDAFENQDYLLVSDLLEYELKQFFRNEAQNGECYDRK